MAIIRTVSIRNFRSIQKLNWKPQAGINCLIGPGDTGKSSIIDAIDLCLGARRNLQISDSDFYKLNVETPIEIMLTIGGLPDSLKSFDTYGLYLKGLDLESGNISEEPGTGLETVLTLKLTVESDLEPQWSLISERAQVQGQQRTINWRDRLDIAPTRLGSVSDYHFCWKRGSLLQKLSDEKADASAALISAAREVRSNFGNQANEQLSETLKKVTKAANDLGVNVGESAQALIDASSLSFNGGTISLHDEKNIPLNKLGLGSSRLLIAGIQSAVAVNTSIVLIDELEHGLEPHRIIRLLETLGAKKTLPKIQVFMTTHSPVVVRELSGNQLMIMRKKTMNHKIKAAGTNDSVQGTIRRFPEALLAPRVLVCEGASEVGLMRGLDQFYFENGKGSLLAKGATLIDGGGSTALARAMALQYLGYNVGLLRDSDVKIDAEEEKQFKDDGGQIFAWQDGASLEDELFGYLSGDAVKTMLDIAAERRETTIMSDQIKSKCNNEIDLAKAIAEFDKQGDFSDRTREILGKASRHKDSKKSWYKSQTTMEQVGYAIVGPDLEKYDSEFSSVIDSIFNWIDDETY